MERETKTVKTPGGHDLVLKTYLTGRESNELKSLLFSSVKINSSDAEAGNVAIGDISGQLVLDQERKSIELLVVSLDGTAEGATDRILDLPEAEYAAVVEEINKIRSPFPKAK